MSLPIAAEKPQADFSALSPTIRERLVAEGVRSLEDWRSLGNSRLRIFGITPSMSKQIDRLAGVRS